MSTEPCRFQLCWAENFGSEYGVYMDSFKVLLPLPEHSVKTKPKKQFFALLYRNVYQTVLSWIVMIHTTWFMRHVMVHTMGFTQACDGSHHGVHAGLWWFTRRESNNDFIMFRPWSGAKFWWKCVDKSSEGNAKMRGGAMCDRRYPEVQFFIGVKILAKDISCFPFRCHIF